MLYYSIMCDALTQCGLPVDDVSDIVQGVMREISAHDALPDAIARLRDLGEDPTMRLVLAGLALMGMYLVTATSRPEGATLQ